MCENYARDIVKVVIGQITQGMGFHAIQQSACDALADILQLCKFFYIFQLVSRPMFLLTVA